MEVEKKVIQYDLKKDDFGLVSMPVNRFKLGDLEAEIWEKLIPRSSPREWGGPFRRLHREDGPAVTVRNTDTGEVYAQIWYRDGLAHRDDGPAEIMSSHNSEGNLYTRMKWYRDNLVHRDEAPAVVTSLKSPDGVVLEYSEQWQSNNKLHRIDGPAHQSVNREGQVVHESWYKDGRLHRVDGPAYWTVGRAGHRSQETWLFEGCLHRTDGPAETYFDTETGEILGQVFYEHGVEIPDPSESMSNGPDFDP